MQHHFRVSLSVCVPPHLDCKLLEEKHSLRFVIMAPSQGQGHRKALGERQLKESGCCVLLGFKDNQLCGSLPESQGLFKAE